MALDMNCRHISLCYGIETPVVVSNSFGFSLSVGRRCSTTSLSSVHPCTEGKELDSNRVTAVCLLCDYATANEIIAAKQSLR